MQDFHHRNKVKRLQGEVNALPKVEDTTLAMREKEMSLTIATTRPENYRWTCKTSWPAEQGWEESATAAKPG